MAVNKEWKR